MVRKHNFCLRKEIIVHGIIPGSYSIEPEKKLLEEMEKYDMPSEKSWGELLKNKHNRQTATYYLMLKQWLIKDNRTLLEYFQQK